MKIFELEPINGRKSFGGKARVEEQDGISYLYSYNTKVVHYEHALNKMVVHGYYSVTTGQHINAFLKFYGFDICTKKELENYNSK